MPLRTVLSRVALICLLGATGAGTVASGDDERSGRRPGSVKPSEPFPLDLAFSRRDFSYFEKAAVSPDGSRVAYAVVTPTKRREDVWTLESGLPAVFRGARLHVAEVATRKAIALGAEGATSFAPAWSPDGTRLAYYSDEGGSLRAWIFDTGKGTSAPAADLRVKVHLYTTTVMPPTWSPDGRKLLVPALPAAEVGADPRPPRAGVTTGPGRKRPGPAAFVLTSGDEPAPPAKDRAETYSHYDSLADLTAIDVGGAPSRVVLPARPPGWKGPGPAFARYSPSGRFLAYVSGMRPGPPVGGVAQDVLDLGVVKVGEAQPLHAEEISRLYVGRESNSGDFLGRAGVVLAWHPTEDLLLFQNGHRLRMIDCAGGPERRAVTLAADWGRLNGDYLAFVPGRRAALVGLLPPDEEDDGRRINALGLVPLDGGPARKIPLPEGFDRGQVIRSDGTSLWQPVADSATFLAGDRDGSRTLVRRLDMASGDWMSLPVESGAVEFHGMPRDGSFLVGTIQSLARPPDFYRFGVDFSSRDRLSTIEPRLEGQAIGPAESFETVVPLHDGRLEAVRTAVLLPPGARRGDRLPAVVEVYGGFDGSRSARDYGGGYVATIPAPIFTTRGFAVLLVDAPLGPEGRPGQPLDELRDAVLPQVYRAAELGYIDIGRVALAGQSYGGYCTAGLISTTNLFRAAVAVSGLYDLGGVYGILRPGDNWAVEYAEKGQMRMGQAPWSDPKRYLDNSPYYRADRIRTPLLIIHGREDVSCPAREAEMMFVGLRRLGRTAQLAVYEGEGHVITNWEPERAVDAADRVLSFLRRYTSQGAGASTER
jgi:dipeptidyl aminopeptidase/acylaminoacyl peptidase